MSAMMKRLAFAATSPSLGLLLTSLGLLLASLGVLMMFG
jgi:hypothetical protein